MKKMLAILLAVTLLFSVMAIGFVAYAEGTDTTVTEPAATEEGDTDDGASNTPTWLTDLINRLMVVLTKVLTKLGIKFALKTGALA